MRRAIIGLSALATAVCSSLAINTLLMRQDPENLMADVRPWFVALITTKVMMLFLLVIWGLQIRRESKRKP